MKEFKLILSTLKRVKSEQEGRKGRRKEIGERRRHSIPIPCFVFLENVAAWHGIHLWKHQTSN